jgi:hypothetical protein
MRNASPSLELTIQHGANWLGGAQMLLDEKWYFLSTNPPVPNALRHDKDHWPITALSQTASVNNLNPWDGIGTERF